MRVRVYFPPNGKKPLIRCAIDGAVRILGLDDARRLLDENVAAFGTPVHTSLRDAVLDGERMMAQKLA